MKTFTTYAEKKAKQILNLLQGYTKGIRFTAMLMLLLVGTTNAWAYDIKCTFIYDNSKTNWSSVQLMVGHGSWSQGYVMTKIANTQLWYYTFSDTWGGATHICVFNASSAWGGEGNSVSHRSSYMDQNTEVKALSGNMTDGIQLITTTSGSDGTAMSTSYHSSYTGLNTTQTATVQSTTDGSNYSTNTNAGSVSISTYKLSSSTASTSSTGTTSASAARTATVTMTASAKTGYTWKGWYNSSGTRQTTSTTLTYSCSGSAATYYARFQANTYTVTLDKQSGTGGTSSVTATYGSAMPSITVPTRTGYTFGGYYTGQNGTGTQYYTSTGSSAKNWDKTSATILYAKWTPATYTVTYKDQGNSAFSGIHDSGYPTQHTYGTATTLKTASKTGYTFDGWFTNSNCTGTAVTSLGATTYTADITLYAKWTINAKEVYLVGEFNWDTADENKFTETSSGSGIYKLTKQFDARDRHQTTTQSQAEYEFKLNVDGTNYTVEGNTDYTQADKKILQYTRQSTTKVVSDGTNYQSDPYHNLLLQTDMTGDYIFTYNAETKELTVTHPTYTPEASFIVGDFSDGATGTDALPKDGGAGHDWTEAYGQQFGDGNSTTICFNGTNQTWEFKIKINGVWYGLKDLVITESGTYTLTTEYAYQSERNCAITTNGVNGCYEFSWIDKGNGTIDLTVGYPEPNNYPTTVYLKPNDDWKADNARFAVYYWDDENNNAWKDMTDVGCNGEYYQVEIPAAQVGIILCSMKGSTTTNDWNNKVYQTEDLYVPSDHKVLYDMESTNITHIYLTPNSNWKKDGAQFEAVFNDNSYKRMEKFDNNGTIYYCQSESGQVKFNRVNPNNGYDKWNYTRTLSIPTDGKNLYTITEGVWNEGDGSWSTIYDNSKWTTYTEPTYDVTINITGKGAIVINGKTYEGTTEETTTLTIEDIVVNQALTVTAITPADRWDYEGDATITIGSNEQKPLKIEGTYEICGPTTINLDFMQKYCLVTFHPNPPKGVIYPEQIGSQEVRKGDKIVQPTVVDLDGYLFGGWYPNGSEYTDANKFDFDTPVEQDLELCARWVPYEQCIFFKNNLNWDNIYVYTFKGDVWGNDGKGVYPANRYEYGKMTQIGYTDVYYYILTQPDGFNYIAFSDYDMHDYELFWGYSAIYRGDRSDKMQLFIPQKDQKPTRAKDSTTEYYSEGIWMKYNSTESGYKWSSDKNGWSTDINPFTAPDKGGYSFSTKVSLQGGTEYKFKVNNIKNDWYSEVHTFTQEECTDRWFKVESDPNKNAIIQPNATGEYLFTIYLGEGKVMVSLEYPLGIGDYRLAYKDNTADSFHPGHYIRKRSTGTHRDTNSFFIFHDKTPIILLQQCTDIKLETGEVTWQTLKRYACTGNNTTDDNPNNAMLPGKKNADGELLISGSSCGVDKTTVYNFVLLQEDGNEANLATAETHLYTGEFYIRTDDAPGGWDYFRQTANQMTFSSYAQQHEHFDHYFCKWIHKDKNVRYTVANDYSYCISDTLFADDIIGGNDGTIEVLPVDANVRFMWDSRDNSIGRAYIAGSSNQADRFLVVEGKDNNLKDAAGNNLLEGQHGSNRYGLKANEEILKDMGNWIYQVDVKANKDALIKLTALYNGTIQYFKGTEGEEDNAYIRLLASDATDTYKIRLIYDFKVNQLIIAWLVDNEDIEENMVLGADMMIIRHNQGRATQINFNNATDTIKNVEKAYAVMTFDKYFLNNRTYPNADGEGGGNTLPNNEQLSAHARALYWISFPFNVKLSDVSGFGEYGDYWILEYYDGADRAKNGLWVDTDTYWKYITNPNYIIQAGQGYVLSLNLNKMGFESTVFSNTAEVSLFFPSTDSLHIITHNLPTAVEVPAHECTIERENGIHKIYDSHWNMIGVPGFADIENVPVGDNLFNKERKLIDEEEVTFYYQYVPEDNTYDAKSKNSENFQIMYSYMVQYCGTINWTTPAFSVPSAIAARSASSMPSEYNMLLELASSNNTADQTYIKLQEERATVDFDLNLDLTKIMNHGENIYTLTGSQDIKCAGNTLPIQRITVPVGVRVDVAGEYTFRMPDGTDGISAILVDNQTGAHTNMLLDEYTVILEAGTYENRFHLIVDPDRTATSVENVGEEAKGDKAKGQIKKFLIDGKLFIRTADGIFDAKGQRL